MVSLICSEDREKQDKILQEITRHRHQRATSLESLPDMKQLTFSFSMCRSFASKIQYRKRKMNYILNEVFIMKVNPLNGK